MARLLFSFDCEDYETPAADDAELWWARAMSRHGLPASLCVVGELARALRRRGRRDVLEAYRAHEVCFHSDLHSAHPTHAEYLETLEWEDGLARVLREEGRGVLSLRETLGRHPAAYCKPGNSWGPQVAAALPRLGIPVFCDAPVEWAPGQPMRYAGTLCLRYHLAFDAYFDQPEGRRERMRADLLRALEAHGDGCVVMYTHPCRLVTAAFPSNFTAGRNPPRAGWRPAPLRPVAEREALMADFDAFLAWVARDLRPDVTTYSELARTHASPPEQWLDRDAVRRLARDLPERPGPAGGPDGPLSAAEQWSALVSAVAGGEVHLRWPERVCAARFLGPTRTPARLGAAVEVPIGRLMAAARHALAEAEQTGALPAATPLGGTRIGPNALLQACARALPRHPRARWPERVVVRPASEIPAPADRDDFAGLRFQGTWSIFPPEFEGRRLLELARLQTWTACPA